MTKVRSTVHTLPLDKRTQDHGIAWALSLAPYSTPMSTLGFVGMLLADLANMAMLVTEAHAWHHADLSDKAPDYPYRFHTP